ncbi:hypothetical protein [Burkholderia contaminans]|uniref:hypothetical protein n=1 Tax=Burkholderia contaminans TaxID=488447 RepID=UPI00158DFD1F|nr:hypothetical protein [Burkholderia contaminans]
MDELNAAPSSTEPGDNPNWTPEQLAAIQAGGVAPMQINRIAEAGGAASGEAAAGAQAPAIGTSTDVSPSSASTAMLASESQAANSLNPADAPGVGGGVDAPSHLLMLDAMLAEIERKIAAGIHLFAHEVTAARDHLAKLLS